MPQLAIATNNGEIGGGEVMLLELAGVLRRIGFDVVVVGPQQPSDVVEEAAARGFGVIELPASDRRGYMAALWRWRLAHREIPLWCNGLVPALSTTGLGPRIIHLHQIPRGAQKAAVQIARLGARRTVVPSAAVEDEVRGATVLHNWTAEIERRPMPSRIGRSSGAALPATIGYLGRLTRAKGVDVLAKAISAVNRSGARHLRLVIGGASRFGSVDDDREIAAALEPLGRDVELRGWVDAAEFLNDIDVLVVPSRLPESFGLVAAEAMAAGTPVIVTRQSGLMEVVGDEHPWVVSADDVDSLAGMFQSVLSTAPERVDEIVSSARHRWENRFSPAAGSAAVHAFLSDLDQEPSFP